MLRKYILPRNILFFHDFQYFSDQFSNDVFSLLVSSIIYMTIIVYTYYIIFMHTTVSLWLCNICVFKYSKYNGSAKCCELLFFCDVAY